MQEAAMVWANVQMRKQAFWRAIRWGPAALVLTLILLRTPFAAVGVVLAWVGWVTVRSVQLEAIACPRCGKTLFRDGMYHNSFSSRCLHCRQEIGAPVRGLFPDVTTRAPITGGGSST